MIKRDMGAGVRWMVWRMTLAALVLMAAACTPTPEPILQADRLLGSTAEELTARLGEAQINNEETANHFGSMRWPDVDGVEVMVILKGGKGSYVTYHFTGTEPFDDAIALARIGVTVPDTPAQQVGNSTARRWQPFGDFERLTINPDTRLVSIGTNPL